MKSPLRSDALPDRLRQVRREVYGEDSIPRLAEALGILPRTWANYEAGVKIDGLILLRFLCLTAVDPRWLATGEGEAYPERIGAACRRA